MTNTDVYQALGVFLVVFITHAIPFLPIPGYVATVYYATSHRDPVSMALAIIATALGASLGKLFVFLYGYGIGKIIAGDELAYAKKLFERISKLGIDIAVFIFAMSPLADDVLYIPLGAAGYNLTRFFISLLAGKTVLATVIVLWAELMTDLFGEDVWAAIITMAVTIALTVLVLRIKWSAVLKAYEEGGARQAAVAIVKSILRRA